MNDLSSVGGPDVNITFKLTPQLLTGKSFSAAIDTLATYVKRWGSINLDFEVGTGPGNATTEGVFEIRLGQSLSTVVTGVSLSQPVQSLSVPTAKVPSTSAASTTTVPVTITIGGTAISVAVTGSTGPSTSLPVLSSAVLQQIVPNRDGSSPASSSDTDQNAAAQGAAAALAVLTAGGTAAAAALAAGEAASAAELAAGGSLAAADAAKAAAEEVAQEAADEEEEQEDQKLSLSLDNQREQSVTSGAPAITTLATTLPATNINITKAPPVTNVNISTTPPVTSAPAITTPVTTTPVIFFSNRTLPSNGTMISHAVSSTCAACATCPGYEFGARWSNLNSTWWLDLDDLDNSSQDEELSPEDEDYEEVDGPQRRALGGRFNYLAQENRHLQKRRRTAAKPITELGATDCKMSQQFISKPAYFNAGNVVQFMAKPPGNRDGKNFMSQLIRWAIPIEVPPGDCTTVPTWEWLNEAQCQGDDPLPDGSKFSKVPGIGQPVWQIGGNPSPRSVNIDHVYEAKYLTEFFVDLLNLHQAVECQTLKNVWDSTDGSKLTNLFDNLPNIQNVEFIGMSNRLNSLKAAITDKDSWSKVQPMSWVVRSRNPDKSFMYTPVGPILTIFGKDLEDNVVAFDPENDLASMTEAAQVLDLMNTEDGINYMSAPNDRIYKAFQAIGCAEGVDWAGSYKSYILDRFAKRSVQIQDLFTKVKEAIAQAEYRPEYMKAWDVRYPMEKMQLSPPTGWEVEYAAARQAAEAQFKIDPASLNKRQAVAAPPAAAACALNANPTAANASSTASRTSAALFGASGIPDPANSKITFANQSAIALANQSVPNAGPSTPAPVSIIATSTPDPVVAPSTTAPPSAVTSAAAPKNGDPCGPAIQDSPNYPNTCAAKVELTTTPSSYGVYCGADGPTTTNWSACQPDLLSGVCSLFAWSTYPKGAWVWTDPGQGCAVGVWIPAGTDGLGAGAAMTPSTERCTDLILQAMNGSCSTTTAASDIASVNIAALPSFSDVRQTGVQVNAGYPSFILAGKSPKGLNLTEVGWTTAQYQAPPNGTMDAQPNYQWQLTEMNVEDHNNAVAEITS